MTALTRKGFLAASALVLSIFLCSAAALPSTQPQQVEEIKKLVHEARDTQQKEKWAEAKKLWEEILQRIEKADRPEELRGARLEARENQKIAEAMSRLVNATDKFEPEKENPPPAMVGQKNLLKFYPQGREIRSVAMLTVKGLAVNNDWVFKGERHFVYIYQIRLSTKVLSNDGKKLTFELNFPEVCQLVFHAKEKVELDLSAQPLARILWAQVDNRLDKSVPIYFVVKGAIELADPRLEKTLTFVNDKLRGVGGLGIKDRGDVEMIAKMESLAGNRLKVDYVDGVGVTWIHVEGGGKLDKDILSGIAANSSVLLDYFIFPGANKKVSDEWEVRARDVASLIPVGTDASLSGKITLIRDQDIPATRDALLRVSKGQLTFLGRGVRKGEKAQLAVKSGKVVYALDDLCVRSARVDLQFDSLFRSQDHLLFRAERLNDVEMAVVYSAEVASKNK